MKKLSMQLGILLLCLGFVSCASSNTRFESTWKNPNVTFEKLDGQKVAAFMIHDDDSTRRHVEDALAREISARGGQGLAGYSVLSTEQAKDREVAKAELLKAGVEAVVTMQILREDEKTSTSPAIYYEVPRYRRFGNYWYHSWTTVYEPGYTHTQKIVTVETLIYRMDDEGLIWAGTSKTVNPKSLDTLVSDLSTAIGDAIRNADLGST